MDSGFLDLIDFFLRFKDKVIENKYENYKRRTLSTNFKIFFILTAIGVVSFYIFQIIRLYSSVKNNNSIIYFSVELTNFLVFTISIVVEIIIFFIRKLYFLRGILFNCSILVILTEISVVYFPTYLVFSQYSLIMMVQIFSVSFFYTKSWITSSISLILGTFYSSFRMVFGGSYDLSQIIILFLQNSYMLILYIFIFYKLDETNRRDFYNLIRTKSEKEFLRGLLREVPVPILHIKGRNPIFVNDPFVRMFDLEDENLFINKFKINCAQNEKILNRLSNLRNSKTSQEFLDYLKNERLSNTIDNETFLLTMKDRESRIQIKSIEISSNNSNNLTNSNTSIFIFTNIDEITEIEKKIQKQFQKILISSFSHDIRTPINGIEGIINYILNLNLPLKFIKKLNNILSLTKKLLYYIDILQDFSLLETNSFTQFLSKFSLISPISEVFKIFEKEFLKKKLEISVINSNCSCLITNDIKRIKEISFILIGNALKYTLSGKFTIALAHDHSDNDFRINFNDSGCGITRERISNIFDMFSQNVENVTSMNPQGLGLPLHVSKRISMKLEGDLFINSKEGLGTSFTLLLKDFDKNLPGSNRDIISNASIEDIKENEIHPKKNYEESRPFLNACNCNKFLVVDDDVMNVKVLSSYLKSINQCCDKAFNGEQAISLVSNRSDNNCCRKYKIIFMDINMPIMDGIKATECLKEKMENNNIPYTPIVAISAAEDTEGDIEQKLKMKGFDGFSQKPISRINFLSIIKNFEAKS